jgi:hypothetical protein
VRAALSVAALVLAAFAPLNSAQACTIIWNEDDAARHSDAVVWGTFSPGAQAGAGTIEVTRRDKGPKAKSLPVRWDVSWTDDGANCPVWQPNAEYPRGRFFLRKAADGTFAVDAQTPAKRAKR